MTETNDGLLFFNGINGATGQYSLPPMTPRQFSEGILGATPDDETKALNSWFANRNVGNWGIVEGHDPLKLEESGWGIVFPANTDPAVVEALKPLTEWRKQQAGQFYKEYSGGMAGVRLSDSKSTWLARQNVPPTGPVDPDISPYYLLLVGSPAEIDYRFQSLLDVQYAVGRICFDTPEEYARYAQSVVEAEKQQIQLQRKLSFFGTANPDDAATSTSANQLILPLAQMLAIGKLKGQDPWQIQTVLKDEALKKRLADFIGGSETPALLFTASHGMSFPMGDPKQVQHQGALLCQDWTGPREWKGPIPESLYFSADDLSSDARLWGTIAFFFACYGAGTPQYDEFARQAFKDQQRAQIAANPFISRLPQRMLAHPRGGALAVIGHVERAWGYSFIYGKGKSLTAFQSVMTSLMLGKPIGHAFQDFNERYGEFSTELTQALEDAEWAPKEADPNDLAGKWTANNDAKNYVVLGDPAVRVMAAPHVPDSAGTPQAERPSIDLSAAISSSTVADSTAAGSAAPVIAAGAVSDAASSTVPAAVPQTTVTAAVVVETTLPPAGNGSGGTSPADLPADYGLIDTLQQGASSVGNSMQQFAQKLGVFLSAAIDTAATLEVATYTSSNMDQVSLQGSSVTGAQLRAVTAIRIDGDTKQVVPLNADGEVDTALWALHVEMVKQAQESRAELIKAAISAAASLVNLGGIK